jgi:hypothetical protein
MFTVIEVYVNKVYGMYLSYKRDPTNSKYRDLFEDKEMLKR